MDGKLIGRPDAGKYDGLDINGIDYYYLQNKINLATKQVAEKNGDIFIDLCLILNSILELTFMIPSIQLLLEVKKLVILFFKNKTPVYVALKSLH